MAENFWRLTMQVLKFVGEEQGTHIFNDDREAAQRRWKDFFVEKALHEAKTNLLKKPYVVIHPGCGPHGVFRQWPTESWKALVARLKTQNPALNVYVTGRGTHEKELADELAECGAVSLADRLGYSQMILALSDAETIFAGNTGIMHLSSFIGKSLVCLSGPTNSVLWGPLWRGHNIKSPLACAPCLTWGHDYGCSDPVCLKAIQPGQVLEAINSEA
jgi:ADP-heptose:LPS heptosyltransferase